MKHLFFSPAAEADLEDIWDLSVEHWGVDRAERYIKDLRDTCLTLADSSKRGRTVDVRAGYRKMPAGSHVVFYREFSERIEVIRVLHKRQDVDRNLLS